VYIEWHVESLKKIPVLIIVKSTTTFIVALVAAISLSTIAYAVPEQQALAWGGGFGFGGGSIVQKNICTKAICINKAENQADGFGFGPET
jgi:hypothetical protein